MASELSFPIEEFIDAITSQLDRVQDALRLKAVNRPLTYALKDLDLELKVYVELDERGHVLFRTSGPNETGASTVHLSFTTITKPMIEENTVSLAVSKSPTLQEAGFAPEEQRRLERLGVRSVAQLERLGASTSVGAVSRLTDVPADRLRSALQFGRPRVTTVQPDRPPVFQPKPPIIPPPKPVPPPVVKPPIVKPPIMQPPVAQPPVVVRPPVVKPPIVRPPVVPPRVIKVTPDMRRLRVGGDNLISEQGAPSVTLNDVPLDMLQADDEALVVQLPDDHAGGTLGVHMPDGEVMTFELSVGDDELAFEDSNGRDAWAPERLE